MIMIQLCTRVRVYRVLLTRTEGVKMLFRDELTGNPTDVLWALLPYIIITIKIIIKLIIFYYLED